MSTTTLTTQQQDQNLLSLEQAVDLYLRNAKTKGGKEPNQGDKLYFTQTCLANKLNPFKRQAHLVGYDGKDGPVFSVITGIDGYRSIAHRTGLYAGRDQTKFAFTKDGKIFSATVTVNKITGGQKVPYTATVFYDEAVQVNYKNEPNAIWSKRPKGQLDKCAEAAALRMAFPDDLGGLYTDAEIDPSKEEAKAEATEAETEYATDPQIKKILKEVLPNLSKLQNIPIEKLQQKILDNYKTGSLTELTKAQANGVIDAGVKKIAELEGEKTDSEDEALLDDQPTTTNP